jgi:UDP-N-acetylglucosamine 2-epimerase
VFFILGTRPEIIKLSPLILALRDRFEVTVVHTGQHFSYEMDQIFFEQLGLPEPRFRLEVGAGSHGEQTGRMLAQLDDLLQRKCPGLVIVQGDTNSTLAGALAAVKLHIPVAHIEAGCRSFNRAMPEEINRVVVDQISHFLFTPDSTATANLQREGIPAQQVFEVGSTGVEACRSYREQAKQLHISEKNGLPLGRFLLATLHRAETADSPERLGSILDALNQLGQTWPVVVPLHPRTRRRMEEGGLVLSTNVRILPPLGYLEFMSLLQEALLALTDSGGVQEEAATLGIPYLVLREETEWQEYIERGHGKIVGWEKGRIVQEAKNLLEHPSLLAEMRRKKTGLLKRPSAGILKVIRAYLESTPEK